MPSAAVIAVREIAGNEVVNELTPGWIVNNVPTEAGWFEGGMPYSFGPEAMFDIM